MEILEKLKGLLPEGSYLVGGFVRDYLLGKKPKDLDLIVKTDNVEKLARRVANSLKANLFGFKKENLPAREEVYSVVLEGGFRIDISAYDDLLKDLSARDFTVNAMAVPLERTTDGGFSFLDVVDPFGGLNDLKRGLIRAIAKENLESDPLRLLRAFRLAADLDFEVEPATREMIKELSPLIKKSAKERVVAELLKAAKTSNFVKFLKGASETSLLKELFSIDPSESNELLSKTLKVEQSLNRKNLTGLMRNKIFLGEFDEKSAVRLLPLATLTPGGVKSFTAKLPLGEDLSRYLKGGIEGFEFLKGLDVSSVEQLRWFLNRYSDYLYPVGVLSYAFGQGEKFDKLLSFYTERYRKFSKPLLSGREVMKLLGLKPSPKVGQILDKLVEAQLKGEVKTKGEAEKFVLSLRDKV